MVYRKYGPSGHRNSFEPSRGDGSPFIPRVSYICLDYTCRQVPKQQGDRPWSSCSKQYKDTQIWKNSKFIDSSTLTWCFCRRARTTPTPRGLGVILLVPRLMLEYSKQELKKKRKHKQLLPLLRVDPSSCLVKTFLGKTRRKNPSKEKEYMSRMTRGLLVYW